MLLDSLLAVVENLRGRIETHGNSLKQSEALTRYALIDPLLRELGWDTEDPDMVVPEYRSEAGSADYALFSGNNQPPAVIVEAKKLGERLDGKVALQSLNYCNLVGTPYFALTDGKTWKIYATFEQAPLADRLITEFAIGEMNAADVSIKALALWRHNVASGSISPAQMPIAGVMSDVSSDEAQSVEVVSVAEPAPTMLVPNGEWHPLESEDGTKLRRLVGTNLKGIMFPDNSSVATTAWNELLVEVVRWLTDNNYPVREQCPIQTPKAKTPCVVAEQPVRPSGMIEVNGIWVVGNIYYNRAAENARVVIKHVGMNPSKFKVQYYNTTK